MPTNARELVLVVHPGYRPKSDPGIERLRKMVRKVRADLRVMSPLYGYLLPEGYEGDPADVALKEFTWRSVASS